MSCQCGGKCKTRELTELETVLNEILAMDVDLKPLNQFYNDYNRGNYYGRLSMLAEIQQKIKDIISI